MYLNNCLSTVACVVLGLNKIQKLEKSGQEANIEIESSEQRQGKWSELIGAILEENLLKAAKDLRLAHSTMSCSHKVTAKYI